MWLVSDPDLLLLQIPVLFPCRYFLTFVNEFDFEYNFNSFQSFKVNFFNFERLYRSKTIILTSLGIIFNKLLKEFVKLCHSCEHVIRKRDWCIVRTIN